MEKSNTTTGSDYLISFSKNIFDRFTAEARSRKKHFASLVHQRRMMSSLKPDSDIFSFGRKRNKTLERHYSWSISASIAKSNKLAFSKLQTTFDFALFSANRRSLRCECSVLNCSK